MPKRLWNPQTFPSVSHYWLRNARVPLAHLAIPERQRAIGFASAQGAIGFASAQGAIGFASAQGAIALPQEATTLLDLEIRDGLIVQAQTVDPLLQRDPAWDLQGGQVWPCFVDLHTHLDKGQIWGRAPNPDGSFATALKTAMADSANWTAADLYRRMDFGLRCSYAQGTQAIRTHLDTAGRLGELTFGVFRELCQVWSGKISLQAACLVPLEYYGTPEGERLADFVAESGGVLGGVTWPHLQLSAQIDRLLTLAQERQLAVDLHVDESLNPQEQSLQAVAEGVIRNGFGGSVVCGHCCSLSVQAPEQMERTIATVREAGIGIVSLPMVNLYLQDRQSGRTPRWRGVAPIQELAAAGVPVALASDNCRDPFHAFGDHDVWEVFREAVRIAHLDSPYGDWPAAVTQVPARLMGLGPVGQIGAGMPADLVLFRGCSFSELLARSQGDRVVLRRGCPIDTALPDYTELDDRPEESTDGVGSLS